MDMEQKEIVSIAMMSRGGGSHRGANKRFGRPPVLNEEQKQVVH